MECDKRGLIITERGINMNQLIKLSRQDIETKYENKPILIKDIDGENWYIVCDVYSQMPLHMLTEEEADLYDENEENIDSIELSGVEGNECYLMWIYFNQDKGWEAYGYE
jgi:hypothetical protein